MDRQEFSRLVFEKLSVLNPNSLNLLNEQEESITIEVISNDFKGLSILKRINKVYDLISNEIEQISMSVDIVALTQNEKVNGDDEQISRAEVTSSTDTGYAAHP